MNKKLIAVLAVMLLALSLASAKESYAEETYDLEIITPNAFVAQFQALADYKNSIGGAKGQVKESRGREISFS